MTSQSTSPSCPPPANLAGKRALLLQGPMGPFFSRLRAEMASHGVEVTKVNFNAGDDLFDSGPHVRHFRGTVQQWPDYLKELLVETDCDSIFLFGDGRIYHRLGVEAARELDIPVFVFEEGYLRPHFITLEGGGVNGYSSMPRDPEFYLHDDRGRRNKSPAPAPPLPSSFWYAAWYSALYSMALSWRSKSYPHYQHHRPLAPVAEASAWVRAGARKLWYRWRERGVFEELTSQASGQFFLIPLQVYCDYQLQHSRFASVNEFIAFAVETFARSAPADAQLVMKHHPLDRGYRDYTRLIAGLRKQHGLGGRLHYVHDLHLPTLLQHCRGCITINSTVGLQAIHHGVPTKVLGTAIYDFPGLTSQASLEDFLQTPGPVNRELYSCFRQYLLRHNQGRGSFYRRTPLVDTPTGVSWPPALSEAEHAPVRAVGHAGS